MAHHVAVGKVDDDEVVLVLTYGSHELVLHLIGTHLGLEVVGCHLRRSHEYAVFAFVRLLAPTVEEEGDVCILLCLCCVQLLHALHGDVLSEGVLHVLLGEEDMHALE